MLACASRGKCSRPVQRRLCSARIDPAGADSVRAVELRPLDRVAELAADVAGAVQLPQRGQRDGVGVLRVELPS